MTTTPLIKTGQGSYARAWTPKPYLLSSPLKRATARLWSRCRALFSTKAKHDPDDQEDQEECSNCDKPIDEDDSTDGFCESCIETHPQFLDDWNREYRQQIREDDALEEAREARLPE